MPFAKGQSGNPAGRPVGSRSKFTREMQDALEENGLTLIDRIVELAGEGNAGAMRQCLDRLIGKHRPSSVALPVPDSPNYVMEALTAVYRALGAGEIASDEAARLVDLIGRTTRVLATKAVAEIDVVDRLRRCEEALVLLFKAGTPAIEEEAAVERAPEPAPQAAAAAIDNNNAKTMDAAAKPTEPAAVAPAEPAPVVKKNEDPPLDPRLAAALDKAVQASLADVRPRRSVRSQLMNSASPAALLIGDVTEKVLAGKTAPVLPPRMPAAAEAA